MKLHVILFQPEIPPNTGNIIRLCANTGTQLHLVRPFGFAWDDKRLRRAGLDYREIAAVQLHDTLDACLSGITGNIFAFTTKATRHYAEAVFTHGDALLFGPETRGLPVEILDRLLPGNRLRIPMQPESRSLNLSNSVAIAVYEAWRQNGFAGGD